MEDKKEENVEPQEVEQAPEGEEKPVVEEKKKLDKKVLYGIGVVVVVLLLVLGWLFIGSESEDVEEPTNNTTQTTQQQSTVEQTQYQSRVMIVRSDGSIQLLNEDGTSTPYITPADGEVFFSTSPDGKFVSKVTPEGLFIASTESEELNFVNVFPKTAADNSISYKWYPDSSKLIVGEGVLLNPEDRVEGGQWIPETRQDFSVINNDGTEKRELFSHQETYGGVSITGINPERNEFYWGTSGEGGPREVYIRSNLTTGEQIDKSENISYINNVVGNNKVYAEKESDPGNSSIATYTFEGIEDGVIFTSPEYDYLKELTENCSEGSNINRLFVSDINNSLYFSLTDAPMKKTTIYKYSEGNTAIQEVYTNQTARELNVLYADSNQMIFSKGFVAHCNDLGETNPVADEDYEYYILKTESNTPTQIEDGGLLIRQARQIQLPV